MAKTVHLSLIGRQRDGTGGETVTETSASAEYYEKNGGFYLLYEEALDGTGTAVKSKIKQKGGLLELTKQGAVTTRMVFEEGREYLTDYATPYGCLKLGILTHKMEKVTEDGKMIIRVQYSLTSEGQPLSDCETVIEILP